MGVIELNYKYSFSDIQRKSLQLANVYQGILNLETIGISHDQREIFMLRLGLHKKYILITAGVHGREYINSAVLLRIAEKYAAQTVSQPGLLKDYGILFVPVLNPDGYVIATEGFGSINDKKLKKNCIMQNINSSQWKWNARAVDINRNFLSASYNKSPHTGDVNSENETKAFINLVQNENTIGYMDIHSRGEAIYYYRKHMGEEYNRHQRYIADRLSYYTGYKLMMPSEEIDSGDTGGNTVHYYSEYINCPAITVETIDDDAKFPLKYEYARQVYYQIRYLPIEFLKSVLREI